MHQGRLLRKMVVISLAGSGLLGCSNVDDPAMEQEMSSAALTLPWAERDIGSPGATGSAIFTSPDVFDVKGAGVDIYGTSDAFHFVYQPITGNATLIAQVTSIQNTNPWAKAGVMIRETLNANSKEMLAAVTPGNGVTSQKRTSTGGSTSFMTSGSSVSTPFYVKIARTGSTITTSRSADGNSWTTLETATIGMTSSAYIGLAVTSHVSGKLCATKFKIINLTNGGPTITTQPQDTTAIVGSTATFSLAATGTGTLSYQWYQVTSTGTIALGTQSTLTIKTAAPPTPPYTNQYYCIVKGGNGKTTQSRTVALNVISATFAVKGLLTIPDDFDCTGGTTSEVMTWSNCHQFKQHLDIGTGQAITSNSYVPGAIRPLAATFVLLYQSWPDGKVCGESTLQTDANGAFSTSFTRCTTSDSAVFSVTAQLKYDVTAPDAPAISLGAIRALWAKEEIPQPYWSDDSHVVFASTDVNGYTRRYVIPTLTTRTFVPVPSNNQLDLSRLILDGSDFPPAYQNYVQAAAAAWQNLVAVHNAARTAMRDSASATPYADYSRVFVTNQETACTRCYSLVFDLPGQFGGGLSGAGSMSTAAPATDIDARQKAGLSSAGLIAHEFGHGIHMSQAPLSMQWDDYFHAAANNPDGSVDDIRHSIFVGVAGNVYQQQETGQALVEGFAEAMARFLLLDQCNGYNPIFDALGGDDMLANMWNPSYYSSCDSSASSGCPYHNFRRQMHDRGIAEGSAEWNRRSLALNTLASNAASGGMKRVLSTNEGKASQFFCKLLAQTPDYSSMASSVNGTKYIDDYLYLVSEILDGRSPSVSWRSYNQGLTSERAHVSLLTLTRAMSQICPTCNHYPSPLPIQLWRLASLTDGGNADYDSKRISIYGMLSLQQLGQILITQGLATKSSLNNLLRASFMEELP